MCCQVYACIICADCDSASVLRLDSRKEHMGHRPIVSRVCQSVRHGLNGCNHAHVTSKTGGVLDIVVGSTEAPPRQHVDMEDTGRALRHACNVGRHCTTMCTRRLVFAVLQTRKHAQRTNGCHIHIGAHATMCLGCLS